MSHLIYVHGCNGSGKTTLARVVIACAGGIVRTEPCTPDGALVSYTPRSVALIGPYRSATGGADSVQPYALVPAAIHQTLVDGYDVFVEGLMTPGLETCRAIWKDAAKMRVQARFILLDVPIDRCTRHVQARRNRKGNEKPYDNAHLVKKHRSASSWIDNLKRAGIPAYRLPWWKARNHCLAVFGLSAEGVEWQQ